MALTFPVTRVVAEASVMLKRQQKLDEASLEQTDIRDKIGQIAREMVTAYIADVERARDKYLARQEELFEQSQEAQACELDELVFERRVRHLIFSLLEKKLEQKQSRCSHEVFVANVPQIQITNAIDALYDWQTQPGNPLIVRSGLHPALQNNIQLLPSSVTRMKCFQRGWLPVELDDERVAQRKAFLQETGCDIAQRQEIELEPFNNDPTHLQAWLASAHKRILSQLSSVLTQGSVAVYCSPDEPWTLVVYPLFPTTPQEQEMDLDDEWFGNDDIDNVDGPIEDLFEQLENDIMNLGLPEESHACICSDPPFAAADDCYLAEGYELDLETLHDLLDEIERCVEELDQKAAVYVMDNPIGNCARIFVVPVDVLPDGYCIDQDDEEVATCQVPPEVEDIVAYLEDALEEQMRGDVSCIRFVEEDIYGASDQRHTISTYHYAQESCERIAKAIACYAAERPIYVRVFEDEHTKALCVDLYFR